MPHQRPAAKREFRETHPRTPSSVLCVTAAENASHSDVENYQSCAAEGSLSGADNGISKSTNGGSANGPAGQRRCTVVRIDDHTKNNSSNTTDDTPFVSEPTVSPQRVQRLSMVERRRRESHDRVSGSITFRRSSQFRTIELTTEYIQNIADAHGVSPEHVRDVALAAQGNTDLMLSILQNEVRNRIASPNSVDTLHFNDAAEVTKLLHFLELPNDWEGEVIRTLNATKGDTQEAAAQLEMKKSQLQSAIEAAQQQMPADHDGEGENESFQSDASEGQYVTPKHTNDTSRNESPLKLINGGAKNELNRVLAHVAATCGARPRPVHQKEREPVYYKLNGAVGARASILASGNLPHLSSGFGDDTVTTSFSAQDFEKMHDSNILVETGPYEEEAAAVQINNGGEPQQPSRNSAFISSPPGVHTVKASANHEDGSNVVGPLTTSLPSLAASASNLHGGAHHMASWEPSPAPTGDEAAAVLRPVSATATAGGHQLRPCRPSLSRGAVDVATRLGNRIDLAPCGNGHSVRSIQLYHHTSPQSAQGGSAPVSKSAEFSIRHDHRARATSASTPPSTHPPTLTTVQQVPRADDTLKVEEVDDAEEQDQPYPPAVETDFLPPISVSGKAGDGDDASSPPYAPQSNLPLPLWTGLTKVGNGVPPPPPPPPPGLGRTGSLAALQRGKNGDINDTSPVMNTGKTRPVPINGAFGDSVGVFGEACHRSGLSAETCTFLEGMFKKADSKTNLKSEKVKAAEEVILPWKTDTAINVMLKIINLPIQQIEASVRTFDTLTLGEERIALLKENIPKDEDIETINRARKAHGKPWSRTEQQELPMAVRFFLMTQSIDHYAERIHAWSLKYRLQGDLEDLEQKLAKADRAIDAIFDSKSLPDMLYFLLEVSNFLNKGSRFQDAKGFPITQLPQIMDFRTTDGKSTLLSCVSECLHSTESSRFANTGLLHISDELLPLVEEGREIDVPSIEQELKKLRGRLQKCKLLIEQLKNDGRWTTVLGKFIIRSLPELEKVEKLAETINGKMERLCTFLCEKKETFSLNEVLRTLTMFCKRFDQELEKIQLRKERIARAEENTQPVKEKAASDVPRNKRRPIE